MSIQKIIMNFTMPPTEEDLEIIAAGILETLPEELATHCEGLAVRIEEFPDEATETDLELEDPYELMALYRSGREISPGIEKKTANDDDVLIVYRRPVLDMWNDTCEDLTALMRHIMIEEIARHLEFAEEDIEEIARRHYQGLL